MFNEPYIPVSVQTFGTCMSPLLFRMFCDMFLFGLGVPCIVEDVCQLLDNHFQVFFGCDVCGIEGDYVVSYSFDKVLFFFAIFAYGPEGVIYVSLIDTNFNNERDVV